MVVEILAPVGAAILAGIGWSTLGIWNKWRNNEDAQIDYTKVRKNVIIGSGIGVVTYGYALSTGDANPIIGTFQDFVLATAAYFPLVVIVDKILNRNEEPEE